MRATLLLTSILLLAVPLRAAMQRSTSPFIANAGQLTDQHGAPNTDVRYLLHRPGLNLQLRADGFSYDLHRFEGDAWHFHRIDVEVVGADPAVAMHAEAPQPLRYFHRDARTGHARITCKDILPHIDLVFQLDDSGMPKYDFVVRPGGHASNIRLRYHGAATQLHGDGSLVLSTTLGPVTERIPLAYVQGTEKPVAAHYHLHADGSVGIAAQGIPQGATLVIDPTIAWGTYLGGEGLDRGSAVAVDPTGVYVAGDTRSTTMIATAGAHQGTLAGNKDVLLARYGHGGELIWCTYFGGSGNDEARAIALLNGAIHITGSTMSSSGMATAGAHQAVHGGAEDAFLARFTLDGALEWCTYFGGSGDDAANAIAAHDGLLWITGGTDSDGLGTQGTHQQQRGGGTDAFISAFDLLGQLVRSSYFGGVDNENAQAIAANATAVYITGATRSSGSMTTPGAHSTEFCSNNRMAYLARFDVNAVREWSTYAGCGLDLEGRALALWHDTIYVAGSCFEGSGLGTTGTYQPFTPGSWDGFVQKFEPTGTRVWGTYFGGASNDQLNTMALDGAGLYIAGRTASTANIATSNAHQSSYGGGTNDAFVARLSHQGTRDWGSFYGGTFGEEVYGSFVFSDGVYITGSTGSMNAIAQPGAQQETSGGLIDAFVARFSTWGVGLDEITSDPSHLSIHPNPAHDVVELRTTPDHEPSEMFIHDAQGRLLHRAVIALPDGRATLQLGHLPAGLHLISLHGMNGIRNGKLLKLH